MANYLRRVMAVDVNATNSDSDSENTDDDEDIAKKQREEEKQNKHWKLLRETLDGTTHGNESPSRRADHKHSLGSQKLAESLVPMPDHGRHLRLFPLRAADARDTAARLGRRRERQEKSEGRGASAQAIHLPPMLSKAEYEAKVLEDGRAGGLPRGGALGGEQGGDPETVREEGYREDEKEFGLGEDLRLVSVERYDGFRRGLRSRVSTQRDRQQMLSEEIDLSNMKDTLEAYGAQERSGVSPGPIQKLYGAAGELSASELDSLCAPKAAIGQTQRQNSKPQDGVTRLLRKLEVGGSVLNLSHSLRGYDDIDSLSRFLAWQPLITTIHLKNNAIDDRGLALLSAALLKAPHVEFLDVSDNVFGLNGMRALSKVLSLAGESAKSPRCGTPSAAREAGSTNEGLPRRGSSHGPSFACGLKHVVLSGNALEDSPTEMLADALTVNLQIRTLNLSNCKVGDNGAAKLAAMLETNVILDSLDLSWNKFGPRAAEALKCALERTQLQHLDLSWNGLGDAGGSLVAEALCENACSLRSLVLKGNQLGPQTCQALVGALSRNSVLETLDLSDNPLMKSGTAVLLNDLVKSFSLSTLKLDRCSFSDCGSFVQPTEFDPSKPNGKYNLDLTDPAERNVLCLLYKAAADADSYDAFINATLDGNSVAMSEDLNWATDPPAKGAMAFEYKSMERPGEEAAPIADEGFEKLWTNLMYCDASDEWKLSLVSVIVVDHHYTCEQAGRALSHFHYTQEKVMAARRLFARVVDLESIEDMLKNLNYTERTAFFEQQGVFGKYHPKLPTGHHSLQLNRQLDYMIACKLLFQYRKEHRDGDVLLEDDIKIPWEPSIKNVASCWKNVTFNGTKQFVSHPDEVKFERSGTLDLDFVSFERPWDQLPSPVTDDMFHLLVTSLQSEYIENPDALVQRVRSVSEQRAHAVVVKMLRNLQQAGAAKKNIRRGSIIKDRPNTVGSDIKDPRCPECLVHDIAWGLQVVRAFCVDNWVSVNQMKDLLYIFGRETQARVEVFVTAFGRVVDFFRMPELMRSLINEEQNLVNRRLGYLSTVNFAYPSMHYRLVLKEPEDFVVGGRLVKIARMTKAQAFYNLKIDDRPINLREDSKMWKLLQGSPQDRSEPKTVIEFDYYLEDEQRSMAAATFIQAKWRAYSSMKAYIKQRKAAAKIKLSFVTHMQKSGADAFKLRANENKKQIIKEKVKRATLVSGKMAETLGDVREQHEAEAKTRAEAEAAHERATAGTFSSTSSTPKSRTGEEAG